VKTRRWTVCFVHQQFFFMDIYNMLPKIPLPAKRFSTNVAFNIFDIVMNNLYMLLKRTFVSKLFNAKAAFKILDVFVNNFDVLPKILLQSKRFSTNAAFKIFNFLWIIFICCQSTFFCPNFTAQLMHSKSLMFSWIVFIYL